MSQDASASTHQSHPPPPLPPAFNVALGYVDVVQGLRQAFTEPHTTGGSYVSGANRFFLIALAMTLRAQDILETGFNSGMTTLAFATTGANVVALDNVCEQPDIEPVARQRLASFPNVKLVNEDALLFLVCTPTATYDLIFIDDCHWPLYTFYEAIEAQRILRPGGCVIFHDTTEESAGLWRPVEKALHPSFERINLPSYQGDEGYSGVESLANKDFGLGIVRKPLSPYENTPFAYAYTLNAHCAPLLMPSGLWDTNLTYGQSGPGMVTNIHSMDEIMRHVIVDAEHDSNVPAWLSCIHGDREGRELLPAPAKRFLGEVLRCWGIYCSNRASHLARERTKKEQESLATVQA